MRYSKAETAESLAILRKNLKRGTVVFTSLEHVSRSGMSRQIKVRTFKRSEPLNWTWHVARVIGASMRGDALVMGGCGMDMGFEAVYRLGRALFPKGGKLSKGAQGRNGDTTGIETDGGYLLTHRWL